MLKKVFIGYNRNIDILKKSSSGGVATTLAQKFIERGGVVISVRYSYDFYSAEFFVAESVTDIKYFYGSKYIFARKEVRIGEVYESLFDTLKRLYNSKKNILFIGLPCECSMVKTFFANNKMNLDKIFFVDLICQGTLPDGVHDKYIKKLEKSFNSKIVRLNVKTTIENWCNPSFVAVFENGKVFKKNLYSTDYGLFFYMFSRKSCYYCRFKGDNRASDLTIGDFWSSEYSNEIINKLGTSVLGVHNDKGMKLISYLDDKSFLLESISEEKAFKNNPMFYSCRKKNDGWDVVQDLLEEKSIKYILKKYIGVPKYYILKIINSNLFK